MKFSHDNLIKIKHDCFIKYGFIIEWVSDYEFIFIENGSWENKIWCKTDYWIIEKL